MLIDETVAAARRLDDGRPRPAERRRTVDQRQCAARRTGRAGLARPRRRRSGAGRRARLCELDLQPRHPGDAPARLLVQTVRLSDRPGIGLPAGHGRRRRADHRRRLEPAQRQWPLCRAGAAARRLRLLDQHRCGPPGPGCRHPRRSPTWRSVSAVTSHDRHQPLDGARHVGSPPDRHDPGLCGGGARRRRGHALWHPPGHHGRRDPALPA